MGLSKQAVDSAAKSYWESFYGKYGKTFVKDVPKRIKSAVAKHANLADSGDLSISAAVERGTNMEFEGLYNTSQGNVVFTVTITPEGDISADQTESIGLPMEDEMGGEGAPPVGLAIGEVEIEPDGEHEHGESEEEEAEEEHE